MDSKFQAQCETLIKAYQSGAMGQTEMPEDANPGFSEGEQEVRLCYFTLPMALNYQRNSYKLWEAVLATYQDPETKIVFDVKKSAELDEELLRSHLMKYKVALQPNKHIATWRKISSTVALNWGSISNLLDSVNYDYIELRKVLQIDYKKGFPYLSGPKIFNYWSFILGEYGNAPLQNRQYIEIAPDTHIIKCSVKLGVITPDEAEGMTRDQISERWRKKLAGSKISPIDMHAPLWFWSRNNFQFGLK